MKNILGWTNENRRSLAVIALGIAGFVACSLNISCVPRYKHQYPEGDKPWDKAWTQAMILAYDERWPNADKIVISRHQGADIYLVDLDNDCKSVPIEKIPRVVTEWVDWEMTYWVPKEWRVAFKVYKDERSETPRFSCEPFDFLINRGYMETRVEIRAKHKLCAHHFRWTGKTCWKDSAFPEQ